MIEVKPIEVDGGWQIKDIYMSKEGEDRFIGLHALGILAKMVNSTIWKRGLTYTI
jgi:hypothetical protein